MILIIILLYLLIGIVVFSIFILCSCYYEKMDFFELMEKHNDYCYSIFIPLYWPFVIIFLLISLFIMFLNMLSNIPKLMGIYKDEKIVIENLYDDYLEIKDKFEERKYLHTE